jgi:hypothetical protein
MLFLLKIHVKKGPNAELIQSKKKVEQENLDSNVIVCLLSNFTATIIILNPIVGSG